ncbi:MAG: flavodoxin [Negativicutes bacterium]|nr:flavodoxin [Negativicutes bacterium]
MNILVAYSSITGNTQKVAEAIHAVLPPGSTLTSALPAPATEEYDLVFVGFWVDKSTADPVAAAVLKNLKGKKVALFATLGAYPDTPYAEKCMRNAATLLQPDNVLVGDFHCQGKIDPKLIEKFKNLPPEHPHAMNPERIARHKAAALHPNQSDFLAAALFAKRVMAQMQIGEIVQ